MRSTSLVVAALVAVPSATAVAQGTPPTPTQVQPSISVANTSPNLPQYRVPQDAAHSGIAYLFIQRADLPAGYGDVCTGALINGGRSVLTAAHCLADTHGQLQAVNADIRFIPVGATQYETVSAQNFNVNSQYSGSVIDEHDVAVINLNAPVTDVTSYNLYTGDATGQNFEVAGWGLRGTGANGVTDPNAIFGPRHGYNTFDFSGADPMFGGFFNDQNVYFADFDSGNAANDASCWLTGFFTGNNSQYCNLGLGTNEVLTAQGDSGGPEFIDVNGEFQIAGVTSFGLTFGHPKGSDYPDVDNFLNSSYGEFGGYTRTDINANWIYANTPEPSSVALLGTGLFGLVPMIRRRRRA